MAVTTDDQTTACCRYLNTLLFQKIWNESPSEYRINFKLYPLRSKSATGFFSVSDGNISLPDTTTPFFIWTFPAEVFNVGLQFTAGEWKDGSTIANDWRTLIHLFGTNGKVFHKASTYFRYNKSRTVVFVAVRKPAISDFFTYSTDTLYASIYYDSNLSNPCKVLSTQTSSTYSLAGYQKEISDFLINYSADQRQYFKNGEYVFDTSAIPTIHTGEYWDFIVDENILFTFDVDLTSSSENPVFLSEKDSTWKQLVHIPKALNPDNKIITHNTCDFYVKKWSADDSETQGVLVHRVTEGRTVGQVTHNDMSIPLFMLDAFRDQLGSQEITLRVVVRRHDNDNVLIRDANFIDLLYSSKHSDDDIVAFLTGKGDTSLSWWTASHLEQSEYVNMMFDTPNVISPSNMEQYTGALGFYHTINVLCQRIVDVTIASGFTGSLTVVTPIFYKDTNLFPVIYKDGSALDHSLYTYSKDNDGNLSIVFVSGVILAEGTELTVVMYVDEDDTCYRFEVTEEEYSFPIAYDTVRVFVENTSSTNLQGVSQTSQTYYRELGTAGTSYVIFQDEDGQYFITFNFSLIGNTIVVQSKSSAKRTEVDISEFSTSGKTIAIPLTVQSDSGEHTLPVLNFENVCLYMNGMYLNRNTDYILNTVTNADGYVSFSEVIIQTMDYFADDHSDILEIITTVATMEDLSSGFVIDDEIRDATPVNLYFPNISTLHINGKIVRDADYLGVYIGLEAGKYPQGANFEIQTAVPSAVREFILEYGSNLDTERLPILNEYFYEYGALNPEFLILDSKHRIYSVFTNTLMWKMLHGEITIADDPDLSRLAAQIAQYQYLKDADLCYRDIDTRFVDFYPQYVNYEITTEIKTLLNKFIGLYAPTNNAPMMEVPYE